MTTTSYVSRGMSCAFVCLQVTLSVSAIKLHHNVVSVQLRLCGHRCALCVVKNSEGAPRSSPSCECSALVLRCFRVVCMAVSFSSTTDAAVVDEATDVCGATVWARGRPGSTKHKSFF